MERPSRKRKNIFQLWRLLFFIGVVVLFAAGGLFWYWKKHKRVIVRDNLQEIVRRNSSGLYNLTLAALNFDEDRGWVRMNRLRLNFDSNRYNLFKTENKEPPILLQLKVDRIDVAGITSGAEIRDGIFRGKKMEINSPEIEIVYTGRKSTSSIPSKEEIYKEITAGMDVQVDSIVITDARIRTRRLGFAQSLVEANGIDITLVDVKVNETGLKDSSRLFFSKTFHLSTADIGWASFNRQFLYRVKRLGVNSREGLISAGEFSVRPVMGEDAYMHNAAVQTDRMDFYFRNLRIVGADIRSLLEERLNADELLIGSAGFRIFHDKNKPAGTGAKKFPHEAIMNTPFRFRIRRAVVNNASLEYKEKSGSMKQPGKVSFTGMNVSINNFTNDPSAIRSNDRMTVAANARFLGLVDMNTKWTFYLSNGVGRFDLSGHAGGLDGPSLNRIIEPLGPARIDKGKVNGLDFSFAGSRNGLNGNVTLLYEDLKVTLLELDKGSPVKDKKFLTSMLANILIKNDNPHKNKPPRVITVNYPRTGTASLFNLCWKGLFQGLRESVGIKNKSK